MTKLSEAAKRDVKELFECGIILPGESREQFVSWHGRLKDVDFLNRIYCLQELPSQDSRFKNAEEDISCHVYWGDLEEDWIFSDKRFHIIDGSDEEFLKFICEVFNPAVTKNSIEDAESPEYYYFRKIKEILLFDGYELYEADRNANKPLIKWRERGIQDQVLNVQVDRLKQTFSSDYMQQQIEQMQKSINTNPTDAIGKAKELVESCCKTILEENNVMIDSKWELPKLRDETFRIMNLVPANYSGNTQIEESIRKLLGNLISITQSLAELRNPCGTGHGRSNSFVSLDSKHARLAVGSSVTLCEFLWATYEDMKKKNSVI